MITVIMLCVIILGVRSWRCQTVSICTYTPVYKLDATNTFTVVHVFRCKKKK